MKFVVMGVGYTGQRVLSSLPADRALAIGRSILDLDAPPPATFRLPEPCAVLYTVPPRSDTHEDGRLQTFLSLPGAVPKRFVYLSTTGVYGHRDGASAVESDAPDPATDRARRRLAAETLLRRWCDERGVALIILRVPGIYGPGRLGVERIRAGLPVIREADANPGNRIHVDDLAACCVKALTEGIPPGIYNVGDGDHRSSTWFTKTVARLAQLDQPPEISRAEAEKTFSPARLSFLSESRKVDTAKMREVMGFTPRYTDPEDGIRASL